MTPEQSLAQLHERAKETLGPRIHFDNMAGFMSKLVIVLYKLMLIHSPSKQPAKVKGCWGPAAEKSMRAAGGA